MRLQPAYNRGRKEGESRQGQCPPSRFVFPTTRVSLTQLLSTYLNTDMSQISVSSPYLDGLDGVLFPPRFVNFLIS